MTLEANYDAIVSESGWGEFEALIQIHLADKRQVDVTHVIKLYPTASTLSTERPVVNEVYDEMVLTSELIDPAEPANKGQEEDGAGRYSGESDLLRIQAARHCIQQQLRAVESHLRVLHGTTG